VFYLIDWAEPFWIETEENLGRFPVCKNCPDFRNLLSVRTRDLHFRRCQVAGHKSSSD
jgi:hypothetical protein